jgi:acyl-CoA thioester hydrolase
MIENKTHKTTSTVCYGDTDAGGVVYYANYLKFTEAARSELFREHDVGLWNLQLVEKIGLVVRECLLTIKEPLRMDDTFVVQTQVQNITKTSLEFVHSIVKADGERQVAQVLCKMTCVGESFRPSRLPEAIATIIGHICV